MICNGLKSPTSRIVGRKEKREKRKEKRSERNRKGKKKRRRGE